LLLVKYSHAAPKAVEASSAMGMLIILAKDCPFKEDVK
jgi:hypothetical protein